MSCYRENALILHLPGQANLPDLSILKSNTDNVYTESKTPPISLHKLDALVNKLENEDVYLTKADNNGKDNRLLLYVILKILLRWYKRFCRYHSISHFHICIDMIEDLQLPLQLN